MLINLSIVYNGRTDSHGLCYNIIIVIRGVQSMLSMMQDASWVK